VCQPRARLPLSLLFRGWKTNKIRNDDDDDDLFSILVFFVVHLITIAPATRKESTAQIIQRWHKFKLLSEYPKVGVPRRAYMIRQSFDEIK
jgi:hypothetical protein